MSYPLPGTRFYERVREELGAKTNWSDSGDLCMMFHGTYTGSFYRALHDALHAEVELWNTATGASAQRVRQLWEVVAALEKTCRTEKPTLLPVLRTAQACAAD